METKKHGIVLQKLNLILRIRLSKDVFWDSIQCVAKFSWRIIKTLTQSMHDCKILRILKKIAAYPSMNLRVFIKLELDGEMNIFEVLSD